MGLFVLMYATAGFLAATLLGFAAQAGLLGQGWVRTKSFAALISGWSIAFLVGPDWSLFSSFATAVWLTMLCMLFWEPGWMLGEALGRGIDRARCGFGRAHRH